MVCDTCKMDRLCTELEQIEKVPRHEKCRCFIPERPITNADRIRQMSDDELATLFGDACACHYDDADVCEKWGGACDRCWLDWLKQEVDDDRT